MAMYDTVIVGAGPAGTVCGKLLAERGYRCLLLERRTAYDEKVCGGWLPYSALMELEKAGIPVDRELLSQGMRTESCQVAVGGELYHLYEYPEGESGLGISRKALDSFLGSKALEAGAEIRFGEKVNAVSLRDGICHADCHAAKTLVMACGSRGYQHLGNVSLAGQSFGISAQIRGKSDLENNRVYFWYETEEEWNYIWAIPIGKEMWNIGMWFRFPENRMLTKYERGAKRYIFPHFYKWSYMLQPRGAYLGNVDQTPYIGFPCLAAGDFAGQNSCKTGEGLRFAFHSAREAAERTAEQLENTARNGRIER